MALSLDEEWTMFQQHKTIDDTNIKKKEIVVEKDIPKSSNIYISTQTKIGYLNRKIDLNKLFWKIPIVPYYMPEAGIIKKNMKINCNSQKEVDDLDNKIKNEININVNILSKINENKTRNIPFKEVRKIDIGISKKDIISNRRKAKGAFYNCFAVIIRVSMPDKYKEIHVKIFNTGKLEIPGIQNDDILNKTLDTLINILNKLTDKKISWLPEKIQTVLINSNFNSGFYIKRFELYQILKKKYKINSNFDPCSYPGIQSKFYYHPDNKNHDGIMDNKNEKLNQDLWKAISFMIFRTGSILIVGNCDILILNIIYEYLKKLLISEYKSIYIDVPDDQKTQKKKKKKKMRTITFIQNINETTNL